MSLLIISVYTIIIITIIIIYFIMYIYTKTLYNACNLYWNKFGQSTVLSTEK